MQIAYFRHHDGSSNIELTFRYKDLQIGLDRVFNFQRNLNETIGSTLSRVRTNFEKELRKKCGGGKKNKTKTQTNANDSVPQVKTDVPQSDEILVQILNERKESITDITWASLFMESAAQTETLVLKVLKQEFKVTYNYPHISQITLPTVILVGFNCYPSKFEVQFAERDDCLFEWFRGRQEDGQLDSDVDWIKLDESFFYKVKEEDVRHKLKLICTPKRGEIVGEQVELISKSLVDPGPGFCAFQTKQLFTPFRLHADEHQFRVVSYNLLADYYCDSDYSRTELFSYCPPFALAIDYRKLIFIRELLGYHSDICCLQEVDAKIFDLDLTICLGYDGFEGTMQRKGDTAEGLATFYHKSKFSLVETYGINLSKNLTTQSYFSELYDKIKDNLKLCERMQSLSTALQVTVLKSKSLEKYLIVANTHLYFHPDADHIRLLQIGFFMLYVKHIWHKTIDDLKLNEQQISIIFCGDFNSVPECGIYKLMTEKFVPDDFIDFQSNAEEAVTKVTLEQPFDIKSAYNNPKYTNFTVGFAACLDYIFYQCNGLKLLQAVPLPSEEELQSLVAIPSLVFPSDHISLVADFEWL